MKSEVIIILGVILTALGPFLLRYGWELRNEEKHTTIGKLRAFEIDPNKPFKVNFGSNYLILTLDESDTIDLRKLIAYENYSYPIQIKIKEGRILVSAEIKNENGITVAKIVDNNWIVNNDRLIAWDRNYNDYAFEVINSDLIPIIQIYLTGKNEIYVGGLFIFPSGKILATPNGILINPSPEQVEKHIQPIFKYPSKRYLGQMAIKESFFNTIPGIAMLVYGISTLVFIVLLFLRGKL